MINRVAYGSIGEELVGNACIKPILYYQVYNIELIDYEYNQTTVNMTMVT